MYKTLIYYVSILATMVLAVTSCACSHNEAGENNIPGKSETRPSEFANDDEFLD